MNRAVRVMHIRDSSGIFGAERVILTLARNINPSKARMELLCLRRKDGRSQRLMDAAGDLGLKVFPALGTVVVLLSSAGLPP